MNNNFIINPITLKKHSILSKKGIDTLKKYILFYKTKNTSKCNNIIIDMNDKNKFNKLYLFFKKLYKLYFKNKKTNICKSFINFSSNYKNKNKLEICFKFENEKDKKIKNNKCFIQDLQWNDIEAEEISIKSLTIKTNSTYNNANKNTILHRKDNTKYAPYYNVFVKNSGKNLSEYIINLGKKKIKKKDFITLFDYLFKKLNKLRKIKKFSKLTLDNHNKDVNILHFKFMDRNL